MWKHITCAGVTLWILHFSHGLTVVATNSSLKEETGFYFIFLNEDQIMSMAGKKWKKRQNHSKTATSNMNGRTLPLVRTQSFDCPVKLIPAQVAIRSRSMDREERGPLQWTAGEENWSHAWRSCILGREQRPIIREPPFLCILFSWVKCHIAQKPENLKVALEFARVAVPVQLQGEFTDKIDRDNLFSIQCMQPWVSLRRWPSII